MGTLRVVAATGQCYQYPVCDNTAEGKSLDWKELLCRQYSINSKQRQTLMLYNIQKIGLSRLEWNTTNFCSNFPTESKQLMKNYEFQNV